MDELSKRIEQKSFSLLRVACSHSLNRVRQAAAAGRVVCCVDSSDVARIYSQQGGVCFVTGEQLDLVAGTYYSISVLRKDPHENYDPDNIVLVIPFVRDAIEAFGWEWFRRMCADYTKN